MNKHLHVLCQLFHYALLVRGYSGYETNTCHATIQVHNPSSGRSDFGYFQTWLRDYSEDLKQG